jgi:hypothetical protein
MYCGNNRRDRSVVEGKKVIGTRYKCFRQGIGVGLNLPYDPNYNQEYEPIDGRRIYCGQEEKLPAGYDMMGSNHTCLQHGVGVGRKIKARKSKSKSKKKSRSRSKSRSKKPRKKSKSKPKRKVKKSKK